MSSDSRQQPALSFARGWKPQMLRLPEGTRERREIAGAALLAALGMLVLGLPVGLVGRLGGMVRNVEGDAIVPALSFAVGSACLTAATWAAVRALTYMRGGWRDSPGTRLGLIILGLLGAAEVGGLYRTVLQVADLHGFYLFGGDLNPTIAYWGLTILVIATAAFALPLIVVLGGTSETRHAALGAGSPGWLIHGYLSSCRVLPQRSQSATTCGESSTPRCSAGSFRCGLGRDLALSLP